MAQEYETVLAALRRWGNVRSTEGGWLARCPAHDDRQGSLLVLAAGEGRVELDCLAGGCEMQDVAAALRLGPEYVVVAPPAFDDGPGWIWPGYVPSAGLSLIDGEDGVSAMAVALDVAVRVAVAVALPDGQQPQEARTVLVLASPQTADRTAELLAAYGPGSERLEVAAVLGGRGGGQSGLRLPGDVDRMERFLREHRPDLVVVDLMTICPYRVPVESAVRALAELARRVDTAVLAVRDASKRAGWSSSRRARVASRSAHTAAVHMAVHGADGAMALVPVASHGWTVMGGLQFHQAGRTRPVVWSTRSARGRDEAMTGADLARRRPASTSAHRLLSRMLEAGPVPARDVLAAAAAVGLAPRTVQRARRQLGVVASKTGSGWVLSLPDRGSSVGGAPVCDQ
ncbi:AAA family ATPase [Kitasatospora sp. NPDC089509]|uniref:AAA family ATPase n=1 Tax=Kitasatospora sp. NPDC089509 TaxID=3364079 RepID=UPI0038093412